MTLLSTGYPDNRPSYIMQKWEYHTKEENVTMIVHFRELFLGYSDTFYAGVGELSPENSSVDYRPAQDCVLTRYDPIQDLFLQSNMIWIVIASDSLSGSGKLWAEVRVVKENEGNIRCIYIFCFIKKIMLMKNISLRDCFRVGSCNICARQLNAR